MDTWIEQRNCYYWHDKSKFECFHLLHAGLYERQSVKLCYYCNKKESIHLAVSLCLIRTDILTPSNGLRAGRDSRGKVKAAQCAAPHYNSHATILSLWGLSILFTVSQTYAVVVKGFNHDLISLRWFSAKASVHKFIYTHTVYMCILATQCLTGTPRWNEAIIKVIRNTWAFSFERSLFE